MSITDRLIHELGSTRRGLAAFAGIGVFEGSVFPFPIEPFVLPIMACHPRRAWLMALALLGGCLIGTFLFYLIGYAAGEALVEPIIAGFGLTEAYAGQIDAIRNDAFLALLLIGLTPVPLQIGTLGGGVAGVDPFVFLAAMTLARGARYMALAALATLVGFRAQALLERYRRPIVYGSLTIAAALVLGAKFIA